MTFCNSRKNYKMSRHKRPQMLSKDSNVIAYYSHPKQNWVRCGSRDKLPVISLHILHDPNATYCMGKKKPYILFWADLPMGRFQYLKSAKIVGKLLQEG